MPQLILKLKGSDFYKGNSLQTKFAIGGLFQTASNFDPFARLGRLYPTLGPTRKDSSSITIPIRSFEFYSDGTNRFLFAFGNRNTSNISAYKINLDTDAITDFSANVHTNLGAGTAQNSSTLRYWMGKLIYDQAGVGQQFRSVNVGGTSDTAILTAGIVGSYDHPSVIGPDGYVYFLNGQYIGKLTSATGTTGNSATTFDTLDSNLIGRDIDHDGRYIVAGFDNNLNKLSGITSDCQIIFWDRFKSYAEVRWPLKEAYIIAVRCLGSTCYVLTPSGWYVCSVATEPRLVYPMSSQCPFNYFPTDFNGVSKDGSSIYWVDSGGTDKVFAIGQKIAGQPKIVYNPYSGKSTTENMQSLIISGSYIYTGTSINRVYKLNSATGQSCTLSPCPQYLPQPFTYSYTKIKLGTKMVSGDSVTHGLYNSDGEVISDNETKSYNASNPLKTLIFTRKAVAGAVNNFTDLYPTITTNVEVAEVEVYGEPFGQHSVQN